MAKFLKDFKGRYTCYSYVGTSSTIVVGKTVIRRIDRIAKTREEFFKIMSEAYHAGLKTPKTPRHIFEQVFNRLHRNEGANLVPLRCPDFHWNWTFAKAGTIQHAYHYDIVRAYETAYTHLPVWRRRMGQPDAFHDDGVYDIVKADCQYELPESPLGYHSGLWIRKLGLENVEVFGCDEPVGEINLMDVHQFIKERFSNSKEILQQAWSCFVMGDEKVEQKTFDLGVSVQENASRQCGSLLNPQWALLVVERVKMKLFEAMLQIKNRGGTAFRVWVDDVLTDVPIRALGTPGEFKLKKGGFACQVDKNGLITLLGNEDEHNTRCPD